jgi:hypothetical protein
VKQENEVTYLVAMGSCGTVSQWERCLDVLSLGDALTRRAGWEADDQPGW